MHLFVCYFRSRDDLMTLNKVFIVACCLESHDSMSLDC